MCRVARLRGGTLTNVLHVRHGLDRDLRHSPGVEDTVDFLASVGVFIHDVLKIEGAHGSGLPWFM